MKKMISPGWTIVILLTLVFVACKKSELVVPPPLVSQSPVNTAPVVNTGSDIKLEIPNTYSKLPFTASDAENNIKSYSWTKISGPASYFIQSLVDSVPELFWLEEGEYEFELTATDTKGLSGKDTVKITVWTNLRKYTLHDLQPDASYLTIAEIPEEVKNNIKWVYAKSAGSNERVTAGPLQGTDYTWGGYYYELISGNRIAVYGGYSGSNLDIIIYY